MSYSTQIMKLIPKKSLGQHFLNSKHVLDQIIEASHIQKGEVILEIGPGTGFLTSALLQTGARVISVEKDDLAYDLLISKYSTEIKSGSLTLIHDDILNDSETFNPQEPYLIVANIPYYITGAILEKFLERENQPNRMILLIQKEVAERIVARDGKESILSISVKAFGQPKIIANVPRGAFTPPPSVDSAILAIEDIGNKQFVEKNVEIKRFFEIVRAGFAHKRKYLKSNLESVIPIQKLEEIWSKMGLNPKIRAEDITKDEWISVAKMTSLCVITAKAGIQN